jgi:NAD(P)-dependent dehydrogenase (short-subunit alcohol dehydrogenase family)
MSKAKEVFAGGVAVITGAGSGIGEGLARQAARLGMKVVLADIAGARIEALAAELRAQGGEVLPVLTDVSDPAALDRLAERAHAAYGDIRLLINNAGIETLGFSWEISTAIWEKTLGINIHGVIHGVRAFAPRMIASNKPAYIANVASIGALGMMPVQAPYILSKHAVLAFSECLYLEMELKKAAVHVSAVLPGPVATRIFQDSEALPDPIVKHHREVMHAMLEEVGITPLEAGERILEQIAAGQFWVSTHPDITAGMAQGRAAHLSGLQNPVLAAEIAASVNPS